MRSNTHKVNNMQNYTLRQQRSTKSNTHILYSRGDTKQMFAQYLNKSHKNLAYKNAIKTTGNIKKTNKKKTAGILKNGS